MYVVSGNLFYLVTVIILSCFLVEVQPREISQVDRRINEYRDELEDQETFVRNLNLVGDIDDRYLADLVELELRSVPGVRNHPPVINVYPLYGGEHPQVIENASAGEFVAFVEVTDPDDGPEGMVTCWSRNSRYGLVKVHRTEYEVVTRVRLDYETGMNEKLLIICTDHGQKQVARKEVQISVVDMNDNPPIFTKSTYEASLMENNKPGTLLLQVHADDRDTGENAHVQYILSGRARKYLTINRDTGDIFAKGVFLCENTPELTLRVIAIDKGCAPMSSRSQVKLKIIGNSDNKPVFERETYQFSIPENVAIGTTIGRVQAVEDCSQIIYNLAGHTKPAVGQMFGIDNNTGDILLTGPVDFEQHHVVVLSVIAKNQNQSLVAEAIVVVVITDVNDNTPVIEINPLTASHKVEFSQYTAPGMFVTQLSVHDADSGDNGKCTCSSYSSDSSDRSGFAVVQLDENEFKVVITGWAEREVGMNYPVDIRCQDLGDEPRIGRVQFNALVV